MTSTFVCARRPTRGWRASSARSNVAEGPALRPGPRRVEDRDRRTVRRVSPDAAPWAVAALIAGVALAMVVAALVRDAEPTPGETGTARVGRGSACSTTGPGPPGRPGRAT